MLPYQQEFIEFALAREVLRFGDFTLKSGRSSPYFFNSGLFNDGMSLSRLGGYYARALLGSETEFDQIYGPAYKGIPLACALAVALHRDHGRAVPYCFNRKEIKDHGEGGLTLGARLEGRVVIVDDVITAGTSVRESVGIIRAAGASPAAVLIALDRQERGTTGGQSAIQEIERSGLPVISIIKLDTLVEYLGGNPEYAEYLDKIREYRSKYGT